MVKKTENLKTIRSVEEAREKGKKGGIKSGEARRARKTLKQELLCLLEEGNTQQKISLALLKQALKGNVKAFALIRDTIGEKPIDKQEITGKDGEALAVQKIYVTPDQVKEAKEHIDEVING